jgi:DNA-binding transcriptional ArsR family regulator
VVESVDTRDLKSLAPQGACGFDARLRHIFLTVRWNDDSLSSMNDKRNASDISVTEPIAGLVPIDETNEALAIFAKALGHPIRIQILRILARHSACICGDIVNELPLAQSTVSEHLRILKAAGLILGEVDGPRVCYCIYSDALARFKSMVNGLPVPVQASTSTGSRETT